MEHIKKHTVIYFSKKTFIEYLPDRENKDEWGVNPGVRQGIFR